MGQPQAGRSTGHREHVPGSSFDLVSAPVEKDLTHCDINVFVLLPSSTLALTFLSLRAGRLGSGSRGAEREAADSPIQPCRGEAPTEAGDHTAPLPAPLVSLPSGIQTGQDLPPGWRVTDAFVLPGLMSHWQHGVRLGTAAVPPPPLPAPQQPPQPCARVCTEGLAARAWDLWPRGARHRSEPPAQAGPHSRALRPCVDGVQLCAGCTWE